MKYKLWAVLLMTCGVASAQVDVNANSVSIKGNVVLPSNTTGYHGSTGPQVQMSDGTGATGFVPIFDANGNLTNGGIISFAPTTQTQYAPPTRQFSTTYQNTTGADLILLVSKVSSNGGGTLSIYDGSSSASSLIGQQSCSTGLSICSVTVKIPKAYFYEATSDTGVQTNWIEWTTPITGVTPTMVYPNAGVAVSNGTGWLSSLVPPTGLLVGTTDTQTLTNKTVDGSSPTALGYTSGLTSDAQVQINGKIPVGSAVVINGTPCIVGGSSCSVGGGITALTGDATASGTGSVALTLATVNASPGCYNLSGLYTCVNAKGLITQIGNPFELGLSCTAAGTYEAGDATTSPNTCTFSYSNGTAASASLTDGTNSVTLTSPYTTGALAQQYCTPGQGVVSFTFTGNAAATNGQTASATAGVNCTFREFGGVGTAGATGATASGTTAVLVGATGTLASAGFGQQSTWGPYTASNQYVYILGTSNACTFTQGGFSFLMNAPVSVSFTNQYGAVIGMWLYRSVNPQNGAVTLLGSC